MTKADSDGFHDSRLETNLATEFDVLSHDSSPRGSSPCGTSYARKLVGRAEDGKMPATRG